MSTPRRTTLKGNGKTNINPETPDRTDSAIADVLFIHGIGGGAQTTWAYQEKPENFWPDWIADEFPNVAVWTASYMSSITRWKNGSMSLGDISDLLLPSVAIKMPSDRPLVVVAHSMGGLLTKMMLTKSTRAKREESDRDDKRIAFAERLSGVAFVATPHKGSGLADFVNYFKIARASEQLTSLVSGNPEQQNVASDFGNEVRNRNLTIQSFGESFPTRGLMVVDRDSADFSTSDHRPTFYLEEDHLTICKPENQQANIHFYVTDFIGECIDQLPSAIAISISGRGDVDLQNEIKDAAAHAGLEILEPDSLPYILAKSLEESTIPPLTQWYYEISGVERLHYLAGLFADANRQLDFAKPKEDHFEGNRRAAFAEMCGVLLGGVARVFNPDTDLFDPAYLSVYFSFHAYLKLPEIKGHRKQRFENQLLEACTSPGLIQYVVETELMSDENEEP